MTIIYEALTVLAVTYKLISFSSFHSFMRQILLVPRTLTSLQEEEVVSRKALHETVLELVVGEQQGTEGEEDGAVCHFTHGGECPPRERTAFGIQSRLGK